MDIQPTARRHIRTPESRGPKPESRGVMSLALVATVTAMALVAAPVQDQTAPANTAEPAKNWTPLRTPDGQPDLQGIWTNYTSTPFEVPDAGDTPGLYAGDPDGSGRGTGPGFLNDTSDRALTKGRSLVVDPPSGRVPIMPWAEERRNYKLAHIQDDWENFTAWERCITRGVPGGAAAGVTATVPAPPRARPVGETPPTIAAAPKTPTPHLCPTRSPLLLPW